MRWTAFLERAFAWSLLVAFFAAIHAGTDRVAGNDSFYHLKTAWLLSHEGVVRDFPWLHGTFFRDHWVNHELLFHALLFPFTFLSDQVFAAKAAGAVLGGSALFAAWWYIRSFSGSRWSWIWLLALTAASNTMLYRLSNCRVPPAALIVMGFGLALMERGVAREHHRLRDWWPLGLLCFFYAWMYNVSVLMVPFAILFALAHRFHARTWWWQPVAAAGIGLALGFVINPYFPHSLVMLVKHVVQVALGSTGIPKGDEWSSYESWYLFRTTLIAWTVSFAGLLALILSRAKISARTLLLLLLDAMVLIMFLRSRRFVEYWPWFSILFGASAFYDAREQLSALFQGRARLARLSGAILALALAGISVDNLFRTTREIEANSPPRRLQAASEWLAANTPARSIVFNAQWDIFPELLFWNHHNLYSTGLDPNFTYFLEPRLYELANRINQGAVRDTARWLAADFDAAYAITLNGTGMIALASREQNGLIPVYRDETATIYRLQPSDSWLHAEGELQPYTFDAPGDPRARCRMETDRAIAGVAPSGRAVLVCRTTAAEATVTYAVELPAAGSWKLAPRALHDKQHTLEVHLAGRPLDASAANFDLPAGRAEVRFHFQLTGPEPRTFAIDSFELTKN